MKNTIILSLLLFCSMQVFAQTEQEVNLIVTDSTWGKEIIQIPFWFAPEIAYKGVEDIRFASGWENIDSDGFWTLAFAWDINLEKKPDAAFFEDSLKLYLDGLMKVVNEDSTLVIPKTHVSLIKAKSQKGVTTFTGTLKTYDAFTTKDVITLNVIIESYYCEKLKKYIPLFKMSPKAFKHIFWKELDSIKLQDDVCD